MNEVKEHIAASLMFEKAYTLADIAQRNVSRGKGDALIPGDGAKIVYDDLTALKAKYRAASDKAIKRAKDAARVTDEPYENLANAVVERAVLDYEIALSFDDKGGQLAIENFARSELCSVLTKLDVKAQLEIVKEKADAFQKYVRENCKAISTESAALRKAGKHIEIYGKYKCPLCGGRLYEFTRGNRRKREYHCSGCALVGFEP